MKIKDITSVVEQWSPPTYQEKYDNCGLLIGDESTELVGILITLDVTETVIEEAIEKKCNLIISHHPLIFSGLKKIGNSHWIERCVTKAIKNDLAIYAVHTNLDNIISGVNYKISQKIGLKNIQILSPKKETLFKLVTFVPLENREQVLSSLFQAGAGAIGNYKECSFQSEGLGTFTPTESANPTIGEPNKPAQVDEVRIEVIIRSYLKAQILSVLRNIHPYEEIAYYIQPLANQNQEVGSGMVGLLDTPMKSDDFLDYLKKSMSLNSIKYTELCKKEVSKVALCGGAGSFLLKTAIESDADIYITSDIKYHDFFEADGKIILADIGHYESEVFTKDLIHDFLMEKFANIAFHLSGVVTNPVKYR